MRAGQRRQCAASSMASASSQAAQSPARWVAASSSQTRAGAGAPAGHGVAPPYSHSALIGAAPRAARASLTGCSYQTIWISLSRRRHGRMATSWVHQARSRWPATAAGLAVCGAMPAGSVRRQRAASMGVAPKPLSANSGAAASNNCALSSARRSSRAGSSRAAWSAPASGAPGRPARPAGRAYRRRRAAGRGRRPTAGRAGVGSRPVRAASPRRGAALARGVEGLDAGRCGLQPAVQGGACCGSRRASSGATAAAGRAPGITMSMAAIVVRVPVNAIMRRC